MTAPELTFGPPRVFVPVSHPEHLGGPIGYVERPAEDVGECPIEPETEEPAARAEP